MIRHFLFFIAITMLAAMSCRSRISADQLIQTQVDSSITINPSATGLAAILSMKDTFTAEEPIELHFAVSNPADSAQRFCKWHTPFEPFISMYLEITDENDQKVSYKGAMAKRIMPPPANAYISVPAGDTVATTIELSKGYVIKEPGTYRVEYRGQNMSGIETANDVTFVLKK